VILIPYIDFPIYEHVTFYENVEVGPRTNLTGGALMKLLRRWVGGADLHMIQLMPLPLTVSCSSRNPDWFYLSGTGSPG